MKTTLETLNAQLEAVIATLATIPEAEQPGNAAYYLNKLAHWVANQGVDEPMVAPVWSKEDFDELDEGRPSVSRDEARKMFALIDHTHNAEIGVNWDVLKCALEEVQS